MEPLQVAGMYPYHRRARMMVPTPVGIAESNLCLPVLMSKTLIGISVEHTLCRQVRKVRLVFAAQDGVSILASCSIIFSRPTKFKFFSYGTKTVDCQTTLVSLETQSRSHLGECKL